MIESKPLLPTADALERESDFVVDIDGDQSYCRHCGAVKEASAKFFVDHYKACVQPRQEARAV